MAREHSKVVSYQLVLFSAGLIAFCISLHLGAMVTRRQLDLDNVMHSMVQKAVNEFQDQELKDTIRRTRQGSSTNSSSLPPSSDHRNSLANQLSEEIPFDSTTMILFVHVGKAGGMTVREATFVSCLGAAPLSRPATPHAIRQCVDQRLSPDTVLPFLVRSVMHKWAFNSSHIQAANYFLFVLRNPVDRYISAFYYRHPQTCYKASCGKKKSTLPFYRECFPTVEHLAQLSDLSISSPERSLESDNLNSTILGVVLDHYGADDLDLIYTCHAMALATARGVDVGGGPHFYYNYKYYSNHTTEQYNHTPVLVIRTENEWHDMIDLDKKFGGTGKFRNLGDNFTHGDETLKNRTARALSRDGYHKLCCALSEELMVFQAILERAVNLNDRVKEQAITDLHEKCGILDWLEWKRTCLQRLETNFDTIRRMGYDDMDRNMLKVLTLFKRRTATTSAS